MKNLLIVFLLTIVACNNSTGQDDEKNTDNITTFYFIRHAEKRLDQGKDPELTVEGKQRARSWVNYFFLKDVDHVLSSDTQRTRNTAAPLAQSKKLEIEIYDVTNTNGKNLLEKYRGKTVALYGHSNTINTYANDLQKDQVYQKLDEADYNSYFIVRIDEKGNTSASKETMDLITD